MLEWKNNGYSVVIHFKLLYIKKKFECFEKTLLELAIAVRWIQKYHIFMKNQFKLNFKIILYFQLFHFERLTLNKIPDLNYYLTKLRYLLQCESANLN